MSTHKRVVTVEVVVLSSMGVHTWAVRLNVPHSRGSQFFVDAGAARTEAAAHEAANRCAESLGPLWVQPEGEGT